MEIRYQINPPLKAEEVINLFRKSDTRHVPIGDQDRIQKMLNQANLNITAWDKDKLVGIARTITDFVYVCYLSELSVDQDYQKRGIGTELIRLLHEYLGEGVAIVLISEDATTEYYPRHGFERTDKGFYISRKY